MLAGGYRCAVQVTVQAPQRLTMSIPKSKHVKLKAVQYDCNTHLVVFRHLCHRLSVRALRQRALAGHFRQQQQPPALWLSDHPQPVDDAWTRHQMRVCDMAPFCDFVDAPAILAHDCVADVRELPVLENEEVVLLCQRLQPLGHAFVPLVEHVDVRLQHADVRTDGGCDAQHLFCRRHIHSDRQVGLLLHHDLQAALGHGVLG